MYVNATSSELILSRAKNSTQTLNSTSSSIKLRHRYKLESKLSGIFFASEVTHQSVNENCKLEIQKILQQVEKFCDLLVDQNGLNSAQNNEANGSRRGNTSANMDDNWYGNHFAIKNVL